MKSIILGSGSPRRRELLASICDNFTVDTGNTFEESMDAGTDPRMIPVLMSQGKSHGFHRELTDDEVLITSDTVVVVDLASDAFSGSSCPDALRPVERLATLDPFLPLRGIHPSYVAEGGTGLQTSCQQPQCPPQKLEVLGKPHGKDDAVRMLKMLSGKTHEVITAVTIRDSKHEKSFADTTYVTFKELTDSEIDYYIEKHQPFDKAGAYGIQEWIGYIGITKIDGSYYTVMGFPVHRVYEELKSFL